jgi:hypothetical protein
VYFGILTNLSMHPLKGGMDNRQPSALGSLSEMATRACSSQTKW